MNHLYALLRSRSMKLQTVWVVCMLLGLLTSFSAQAQCTITLKPTVSGCYQNSGSKATVQVEVTWTNAPAGENIIVTGPAGSVPATRTITPGLITVDYGYNQTGPQTIVSPQVVAFEIPANSASGLTASANFVTTTTCSAVSPSFSAPAPCQPTACPSGSLGGTVFNDFNADGIKDAGETAGIPNVAVKAIGCDGTTYTATTDAFGQYSFTIPAGNYPVRVEFSSLPSYAGMGTQNGTDGQTTVQFVNAADCSVDLGVLNSNDYCETNPRSFVSCFVNGDPINGDSQSFDALVGFDYSYQGVQDMTKETPLANAGEIGSVWGLAYNKYTKRLFGSAILRRHVGLSSKGLGGIFVIDPNASGSKLVASWDVTADMGVNVGTVADNVSRGLTGLGDPSNDADGYAKVGKVGIGDLEISDDGNALFFTNLFDKKLYKIDITAYNGSGTKPGNGNVSSFTIPDPGCVGGVSRPWGLKVYKGKVYVGVVCDASTSQNKADLRAYVYAYDLTTNAWNASPIFDFPLTYPKGYPNIFSGTEITGWFPWTDDWAVKQSASNPGDKVHPEPILTDIEFDIDGSMVLAFGDHTGFQGGLQNFGPADQKLVNTINGGDILRAYSNNGTYILENNAKAGPSMGSSPDNNQGPGFGEFYNDNFVDNSGVFPAEPNNPALSHAENVFGALALRPGSGEVMVTVLDPIDRALNGDFNDYYNSGGFRKLSNTTGLQTGGAQIYRSYANPGNPGTFAKAVGLGDLELGCSLPTYIEIGNRVWIDTDQDGEQDACEKALANLKVALYQGSTLIATTTTNASGNYYFSDNTKAGTTWPGSATALLPNTAYTVRFGTDGSTNQFAANVLTVDGGKYQLTTANATGTNTNDMNDSDAQVAGGFPSVDVTTGPNGTVNHTIDAGFICITTQVASIVAVQATCTGATANNDGQVNLTGITNGDKAFIYTAGPAPSYTATGGQTVTAGAVAFTGLTNPASAGGQSYSVIVYNGPCCYTVVTALLPQKNCSVCSLIADATPTACIPATNQYSVSGTITLTNNTAGGTATITDGTATTTVSIAANATTATYTLSGITSDGTSHTVTVSLPGCGTTVASYPAPASCTVCSLSITTTSLPDGQVGSAYNQTIQTSGGTAPLVFSTAGGSLPAGLTLNADGSITGTPTASGTVSFTVSVSDAKSCSAIVPLTITTSALPVCSLTATATPTICNTATNQYDVTGTVSATNTPANQSLTISVGSVNTVVTLTGNGPVSYTLTGLDSDGLTKTVTVLSSATACGTTSATYTAPVSCTVAAPTLTVALTTPVCNSATNQYTATGTVSLSNVVAGTTLTVTDNGVTISTQSLTGGQTTASISLSGVSDASSHTVVSTLTGGTSGSVTYNAPVSCTVCSLSITTTSLPDGQVGSAYNQTIQTSGGTAPLTFTSIGNLPGGLALDGATGVISGTPTSSATVSFTIKVTDSKSCSAIVPLTIMTSNLPVCSLTATATPTICNTATNQYTVTGTVSATNTPANQSLTISVGSVNTVVTLTGNGPVSYTLTGLNSDGLVKTMTVTSSATACGTTSQTYTAPVSCTVALKASLGDFVWLDTNKDGFQDPTESGVASVTVTLCDGTTGAVISTTVTDNAGKYLFTNLDPGIYAVKFTAPAGTTFTVPNSSSATPSTDSNVNSFTGNKGSTSPVSLSAGENNLTIDAGLIPIPASLTIAIGTAPVCNSATNQYTATGTVSLSNVPAGATLTVTDNGVTVLTQTTTLNQATASVSLSGVSDGSNHTLVATLSSGATASSSVTYNAPTSCTVCSLSLTTTSLPAGQVGTAYNQTIQTSGGTAPLTFTSIGNLPGGLALDGATGVISGTPTSSATVSFTIKVTDSKSCSAIVPLTIMTSNLPVCSLTATATPTICNTATNQYTVTGTVSATNTPANQSLTISVGSVNTVVTLTGNGPVSYTLTGLDSDGLTKTVTVLSSATACGTTSVDYTAPTSCTVAAPALAVSVTTPVCDSATNQYTATGTVSLSNVVAGTTLTVTDNGLTVSTQSLTGGQTTASVSLSGVSDASSHTVVSTLTGGTSGSVTYNAPVSCTVCSLSITTSSLPAGQVGTAYNQTIQTSGGTAPLVFSTAGGSLPAGLTLNADGSITGTPTASGTASFTAKVTDSKSCSALVPLTITTSNLPVCSLTATATPGTCNTATNQYTVTGTVSATNTPANQSLTISVGSVNTVVTLTGNGPVSYTLTGLDSDGLTKTVTVLSSATACGMTSVTYTAPVACTVCSLSLTTASLPNGQVSSAYSQTINTTGGTAPLSYTVSAGTLPAGLTLNPTTGVIAGIPTAAGSFTATLRVTDSKGCSVSLPLTVLDIDLVPVCSLSLTVTPGSCNTVNNAYTLTGTVSLANNTTGGTITVTNGLASTTLTVSNTATSVPFSLTGLGSDGQIRTVTATLTGCGTASQTYTAPVSCTQPVGTKLALDKLVNLSKAKLGDIITYTIVLTNVGTVNATNVVVTDSSTSGLTYVINSASAPAGTTFTQGSPISTWTVASLSAGQSLSLTFQARADSSGILYNKATIPGDTATVCTSVPVVMCQGDVYTFRLTVPAGRSSYQWYKDNVAIAGQTTNSLDVTGPGTYSVAADNTSGKCPGFSCCPFIIEEDSLPVFRATATPVTCVDNSLQTNGKIVLTGFKATNTYQYSLGTSFNAAASLSGAAKAIPVGGVLVSNLANPTVTQAYTVRVYNASGCYLDQTVLLVPTVCGCPADVCVPFVVKQTKRALRIGDSR